MNEHDVRETLYTFITRDLVHDSSFELADDEGIITGGLMDSFTLTEFAVFVASAFGVYIPVPHLTVAKMNTLDQMVARVMAGF